MDSQEILTDFYNILQDTAAARQALEAVQFAAKQANGPLEPIAAAYKSYLASGWPPYSPKKLADVYILQQRVVSDGHRAGILDILYHHA